jgi:hypothetical protein
VQADHDEGRPVHDPRKQQVLRLPTTEEVHDGARFGRSAIGWSNVAPAG